MEPECDIRIGAARKEMVVILRFRPFDFQPIFMNPAVAKETAQFIIEHADGLLRWERAKKRKLAKRRKARGRR